MSCGYGTEDFIVNLRAMNITPHIAQNNTARRNAIDERATRHEGYALSQRLRKRVEEVFGLMKTVGPMRKTKLRGRALVDWQFTFTAAIYNLVRMRNIALEAT